MLGGTGNLIIVQVDLRTDKPVCFLDAEQEPGVYLDATVPVLAGRVAPFIVFVGGIAHAVKVFLGILIGKLPEDTKLVVLEK